MLRSTALIIVFAALLATPASADAARYKDRGNGYSLSIDYRKGDDPLVFVIPKKLVGEPITFFVYCGRTFTGDKGDLALGTMPISPIRRFTQEVPQSMAKRRCTLFLNDDEQPTAKFKLRRG
ncbi:MAG: hypothetical protein WKF94_03175 [Solirubrobacteraceae bacterium]